MLFWGTRKTKQLLILGDFYIFATIKVNVDQQLFGYLDSPKYLISVQHKKEMNTGLGQHESVFSQSYCAPIPLRSVCLVSMRVAARVQNQVCRV